MHTHRHLIHINLHLEIYVHTHTSRETDSLPDLHFSECMANTFSSEWDTLDREDNILATENPHLPRCKRLGWQSRRHIPHRSAWFTCLQLWLWFPADADHGTQQRRLKCLSCQLLPLWHFGSAQQMGALSLSTHLILSQILVYLISKYIFHMLK